MAYEGTANIDLPKSKIEGLNFSFSGIKTAVINIAHKEKENLKKADLAYSFEQTVTDELVSNCMRAMKDLNINKVVLAGGVSANLVLREKLQKACKERRYECYMPDLKYCTDNAAMIASAAHYNYISGKYYEIKDKLDLNAIANLKIGE